MRDPFAPVIEGFDCNGITSPWSFQSETFYEDGGQGGTMLDGTTVHDVLAVKKRLSWTLNVLTMSRYNELVSALALGSGRDTVSAVVFDPETGGRYSTTFHVSFPVFRFIQNQGVMVAFTSGALVLEETGTEKSGNHIVAAGDDWRMYDDGTIEIDPADENTPEDDQGRRVIVIPTGVDVAPDIFDDFPNLAVFKIMSFPSKSSYVSGETLDLTGLVVKAHYTDGTEDADVTSQCKTTPRGGTVLSNPGDVSVVVTPLESNAEIGRFTVSVVAPKLRIYVENDVLVISGTGASVSGDCLSLVSGNVSVSGDILHSDQRNG